MRGKVLLLLDAGVVVGITPAYAGKRISRSSAVSGSGDHPRVCGEKVLIWAGAVGRWGSPPRMRGKDLLRKESHEDFGITPAYAGKRTLCGSGL